MPSARFSVVVAALVLCLTGPAVAGADPGDRWQAAGRTAVPLNYYQGLTHVGSRLFFVGIFTGGYLTTNTDLHRIRGKNQLIPRDVRKSTRFNHVGDPSYDPKGGGRLLLPLECYYPLAAKPNSCGFGGIGVINPVTLTWQYWVRLSGADVPKASWIEVAPDGKLAWTSSGKDLVAYRTADIARSRAAKTKTSKPIRPVRRLPGAVPPSGVTGAAFADGRLLLAGGDNGAPEIWSVDLATGATVREIRLSGIVAETEGIDVVAARGGTLQWLLTPGFLARPTYGSLKSQLLTFTPVG